jgi:RimJ/RimL family protein N-acetyltransferase
MNKELIHTESLTLVLQTPEDVRALIAGMSPSEKAELSADWLAWVHAAMSADPWIHGFALVHRASDAVIGTAGFKGPPAANGVVEIAYGVAADYQV